MPATQGRFSADRLSIGSRGSDRRLARYRVGGGGRIRQLKRRYGLDRSRLKGHERVRTRVAWRILAYNLDMLAVRAA